MLYRGFTITHETAIDYYVVATRSKAVIFVDYDRRTYDNQIPLSQAQDEAEEKLRLLIDAFLQDSSALKRLPAHWTDGYKYEEVSVQDLREAIDRVLVAPGQLALQLT